MEKLFIALAQKQDGPGSGTNYEPIKAAVMNENFCEPIGIPVGTENRFDIVQARFTGPNIDGKLIPKQKPFVVAMLKVLFSSLFRLLLQPFGEAIQPNSLRVLYGRRIRHRLDKKSLLNDLCFR